MNKHILDKIVFAENNFPWLFSKVQHNDYGVLFFNEEINISHDSNHAILNNNISNNYSKIIDEIIKFYEEKNIEPRIYSSLDYGQLAKVQNTFIEKNMTVEAYSNYWIIKKSNCSINEPYTLKIERMDSKNSAKLATFYDNEWEFPLFKRKIENNDYHFFAGFEDDIPVSIGAIQSINDIWRLDDIETKVEFRGKGYSRQIVRHLTKYHQEIGNNKIFYSWYNNPIAGKIYREAGFVDFENKFESWAAYKNN